MVHGNPRVLQCTADHRCILVSYTNILDRHEKLAGDISVLYNY